MVILAVISCGVRESGVDRLARRRFVSSRGHECWGSEPSSMEEAVGVSAREPMAFASCPDPKGICSA